MRLVVAVMLGLAMLGGRSVAAAPASRRAAAARVERAAWRPTAFSVEVRGRGRPVILIPGLGCPASVWRGTAQHLRGDQTHTLTLAGFAGVPRIEGALLETTVTELARYIRVHRLNHPVIIGHSLGGFVAYWLAARYPQLVGPVVVVDAGAAGGTLDHDAATAARNQWRNASPAQFHHQIEAMFGEMAKRSDRLAPVLRDIERSDPGAFGDAVFEASVTTLGDQLARITAPVLLVLADGAMQDDYRRQARAIRHVDVVVLRGTGHFVMLDDPAGFDRALDRFLAHHRPGVRQPPGSRPSA